MDDQQLVVRKDLIDSVRRAIGAYPVVALLGPRQSGKTTLARAIYRDAVAAADRVSNYFDLEDPESLARLSEPKLALQGLSGLVVIDEIQRQQNLFPLLRVLADRPERPARFLILGSASPDLVRQGSESLAGRIKYIDVTPLSLKEVGSETMSRLWLRGGYPPAFLASDDAASADWREQYIRAFLERDLAMMGLNAPPIIMRRLWTMLTHYHGQIANHAELAGSLDLSQTTVKRYVDILVDTFMLRRLNPWHVNIAKRQVKSPKIYLRDSGLLHRLINVTTPAELLVHPSLGASWEGFALEELIKARDWRAEDCYFWAVHGQCELDLVIADGQRLHGFEIKHTLEPKVTKSMMTAVTTLGLEKLTVIYPGEDRRPLGKGVEAVPLAMLI
jgi:predicted AAA+ superfamily ATPase